MEGPIKMLQSLTPDQTKFLGDLTKQVLDKGIWLFLAWGGVRLKKSITSIRPQIVAEVIAGVKENFDAQFAAHTAQLKDHQESDARSFESIHRDFGRMNRKLDHMSIGHPSASSGD